MRFRIHTIEEFRKVGLRDFGEKIFRKRLKLIENYTLGIELLIYGFDVDDSGKPCIFEVSKPGVFTDHQAQGFGVIGSGFHPAFASLTARGSNAFTDVNQAVYRLCEAKFRAETADVVGKPTTVMVFRAGKMKQMPPGEIEKLHKIWLAEGEKPIPKPAEEVIREWLGRGNFMKEDNADT